MVNLDPHGVPYLSAETILPFDLWPSQFELRLGFAHANLFHEQDPTFYGLDCHPWAGNFLDCGPSTFTGDTGVRFADLNGDGLTDVVWKGGDASAGAAGGVLLNTGGGSEPFSAWCASDPEDGQSVGGACPEAAAYVPPRNLVVLEDLLGPSHIGTSAGMFADLNGDGLLDFIRLQLNQLATESWLQSPAGATPTSVWQRDTRFDFLIDWGRTVTHPLTGNPVFLWLPTINPDGIIPNFQAFDVDGDGSADLVGDLHAFLSESRYSDLVRSVDNGRGGFIDVEYDSRIWQRDASLEAAADLDAQQPETPEGGDASLWRARPVVSRVTVSGPDFAEAESQYRYAHPRFSTAHRADLGFRIVEETRPDASTVEEYFYQDHGRAGRTSKRLVKDGGAIVHRYEAGWELPAGAIPGSISNVFVGRLAWEERVNEYGTESGALLRRELSYDDVHGYNFVSQIRTERPTGVLVDARTPDSDLASYVIGRIATRTLTDGGATTLRDTILTYLDLDNNPTGPKIGSRRELIAERGGAGGSWVDVAKLRYDGYGNLIEEQTPSPTGGVRSTLHCYDGDTGWCPSPEGHSSHSVRVATQDPLGMVTRRTPDLASGILVEFDSDYTDEPDTRVELDPFGRPVEEHATPTGGSEVLVAQNVYDDANGPLRVERFEYTDEAASDSIYSAGVFGAFGGLSKAIAKTPSGYVGTMRFADPAAGRVRTTLPVDCDQDAACALFTGATEPAARVVESDALGRTIRVDTPDGFAILAYGRVDHRWGTEGLDLVLEKNPKGDLVERAVDGDRNVWVDECHLGVDASLTTLAGAVCGTADTTRYTHEATGEIGTIYDPRAVASSSFSDPDHYLRYTYDTLGRVRRIDDPDLSGPGYTLTAYDDAGMVESTTNARGQTRSYAYDELGRLTGITTPSGELDYTVTYRATEWQREKDSSTRYERLRVYDGWGRLEQTQLSVVENWPVGGSYPTDFEYDLTGRLVQVMHPESTTIRYEYEGAYLKRVCDLGTAADCSDSGVVEYVSDVTYDELGRRTVTTGDAGTRTFAYDGRLPRLLQDRFVASTDPYWFERNYDAHDELGNILTISGSSQPGDIELDESYTYDSRNRLDSWTKEGTVHAYGYDDLGNLTLHADSTQTFDDTDRPHAVQNRSDGNTDYTYDDDGNVTSIIGVGSTRYFKFDSANRLMCVDTAPGGCGVSRIFYDVDGRRVLNDRPGSFSYVAYVDDSVREDRSLAAYMQIEIRAFGERIAYKRSGETIRAAGLVPPFVPPRVLPLFASLGFLGLAVLLACAARHGALVLVIERPAQAGLAGVLGVALIFLPIPPRLVRAGGGGGASIYWELADRLGTGMVMLDENGARLVHRTYSPLGVEDTSAGTAPWIPSHYAGHLEDEDSGLTYMQARWYDPASGTFLSVDPVVADAADPQSYNAYAYARNNPVRYIDPTGMGQFDCFGNCAGAAGAPPGWASFSSFNATVSIGGVAANSQTFPSSELTSVLYQAHELRWTVTFAGQTGLFFDSSALGSPALGSSQDAALAQVASPPTADAPVRLEGVDQTGIKGTLAPTGVGPAGGIELRSSTTRGAELVITGGVGAGGSVQVTPVARTGLALTVGEIGPVHGVAEATFPTGIIPGTVFTVNLSLSVFPLGTQFSVRAGLGGGASGIAGLRAVIPLSADP